MGMEENAKDGIHKHWWSPKQATRNLSRWRRATCPEERKDQEKVISTLGYIPGLGRHIQYSFPLPQYHIILCSSNCCSLGSNDSSSWCQWVTWTLKRKYKKGNIACMSITILWVGGCLPVHINKNINATCKVLVSCSIRTKIGPQICLHPC